MFISLSLPQTSKQEIKQIMDLEARADIKAVKEFYGLLLKACSVCFLVECRLSPPTLGLGCPPPTSSEENTLQPCLPTAVSCGFIFSAASAEVPSSQMTQVCVTLITNEQTNKKLASTRSILQQHTKQSSTECWMLEDRTVIK